MGDRRLRVLLVEDDEARRLPGPGAARRGRRAGRPDRGDARSREAAAELLGGVDCVLLDLGLPDAQGLDGLRQAAAPRPTAPRSACSPACSDEHLGVAAVAEGAQDYLVKGQVDGALLARALRYAVERKRADENARRLREVELRQAGVGPAGARPAAPAADDAPTEVAVHTFYRPGRHSGAARRRLLRRGADRPGPAATLMVGDVCGHGVDEAALGVELRVAWRALMLAGVRRRRRCCRRWSRC